MRKIQMALCGVVTIGVPILVACGYQSPSGTSRVATTVRVSLAASSVEVHEETVASVVTLDQYGAPVAGGPVTFTSSAEEVAVVNPATGRIFAVAPGTAQITALVDGKTGRQTITVVQAQIRINEVNPDSDSPGGFVELINPTTADVDMENWSITAEDVLQGFTVPAGATIRAGGFLLIRESDLPLGLRAADTVHLFSRFGVQVDSFTWTSSPVTSFGRCPDGTGDFVTMTSITRAVANACPAAAPGLQALAGTRMPSPPVDKELH